MEQSRINRMRILALATLAATGLAFATAADARDNYCDWKGTKYQSSDIIEEDVFWQVPGKQRVVCAWDNQTNAYMWMPVDEADRRAVERAAGRPPYSMWDF